MNEYKAVCLMRMLCLTVLNINQCIKKNEPGVQD